MNFNVTAHNIIIRRSLVTKIRQFSSSSITNGSSNFAQTKTEKTQPSGLKEAQASSSKWNDFLFAFASKFSSTNQGVGRLMKKFVAADYIESSRLLNLLDLSSPLISPLFSKSVEPNIMVKSFKNGLLITVDAIGFTKESDLQIKMEHGCVLIEAEANTIKGDKVIINEVVPVPAELKYDPSEVTAQLIGGVVLVFVPDGSKEEGKDMCVNVVWGDVMKLITI